MLFFPLNICDAAAVASDVSVPVGILLILLAIVSKVAVALVLIPLSVIALATALFPLLTDVFKELVASAF